MNKRHLSLASMMTLCFLLLLISGCGSSANKESSDAAAVANVGDTACVQCHSANVEALTGQGLIAQYTNSSPHKDSAHANAGNGCEACHGSASQHQGKGPIAFVNPYDNSGARCADCHAGNYAGNFNTKFASSNHASVAIEESAGCVRCHTHEGAVLGNIAGLTGDLAVLDNKAYQTIPIPSKGWSQFKCQTCHEHGGGLRTIMARYNNPFKADAANGTVVSWDPNNNREHDQYDLCTSCHTMTTNTYATGVVSGGRESSGSLYMASGTPAHAATGKPATVKAGHHETSWYRLITTTHYDNPATGLNATDAALSTGNVIEGYVLRGNKETPCFDCHAHEAKAGTRYGQTTTPTIHSDWAQSGHAGGILKAKYAAAAGKSGAAQVDSVMISGAGAADTATNYPAVDAAGAAITITRVTNAGDAWAHYQWERTLNAAGASDRGTCQRCHTATGAANYLSSPATYDYKKNDFSHLSGWVPASAGKATTPSPQQEVLYCWGCHSNAGTGALRNPGVVKADYNFKGVAATFPDSGASNICFTCHSGQASGESITALTGDFKNVSFVNSHYMAVAGLMYVKSGFTAFIDPNTVIGTSTYGASLTSNADGGALSSTHRNLGTPAMNGDSHNPAVFVPGKFDSNGPCVTCHMQGTGQVTRSSSHTWEINWTAYNEVCLKCHDEEGGVPITQANYKTIFIEEQAVPFEDALELALNQLLTKYNISFNQAVYPYFYDLSIGPTAAVKDWTRGGALSAADAKKLMGACFNINLLKREPAAYVHARTYTRRLLYDTIDFLDNRKIDMSVGAAAVAYSPVKYVRGATSAAPTTESYKYLAGYNRTSLAWNALQRP